MSLFGMKQLTKHCRVVCLCPYPKDGPSVRHRVHAYKSYWRDDNIDLTLWPFMTVRLYHIRRLFGLIPTIEKIAHFIFCTIRLMSRVTFIKCFDVVIIHREAFPLGPPLFEKFVMRLNPNVIYDLDDAIWHEPSNDVNQRKLFWCSSRVSSIIVGCKQIVSGSPYIAKYANLYSDNVTIIPTSYDSLSAQEKNHSDFSPPVIVWIGNVGNAFYLKKIIPVLDELSKDYSFVLRLIGGDDIYNIQSSCFQIKYHIWSEQVEKTLLGKSDIGIMPLVNGAYEQGKCSFKIIQYFSASLPVIASAVGMNVEILEHGKTGYLVNSVDDWREAFKSLLQCENRRIEMGLHGNRIFNEAYNRKINASKWADIILSLYQAKRG